MLLDTEHIPSLQLPLLQTTTTQLLLHDLGSAARLNPTHSIHPNYAIRPHQAFKKRSPTSFEDSEAPARMSDTQSTSSPTCYLLELPAELRNNIYELAFPSILEEEKEVNISEAAPPSKALALTCKQIRNEANKVYQVAYQQYWTNTKFVAYTTPVYSMIVLPGQAPPQYVSPGHHNIRPIDFRHINHLKVYGLQLATQSSNDWQLIDPRGMWKRTWSSTYYGILVVEQGSLRIKVALTIEAAYAVLEKGGYQLADLEQQFGFICE